MKTTPEHSPKTDIHQKTQNIRKLLPETTYTVSFGIYKQDGGEAAVPGTKAASLLGMEIRPLRQIARMIKSVISPCCYIVACNAKK